MQFNILDPMPDWDNVKSFTDRYFSKRYILNVDGIENNDIMLMFHSNRITLIGLAPSHFFFKNNEDYKVNFNLGKIDRLCNVVKGKGKKGGQSLMPRSVICRIEYDNDRHFDVPCCMKGTLVEVNEQLVTQPGLLRDLPDSNGYIAIVLSSIAISEAMKNEMLHHEEYIKLFNRS